MVVPLASTRSELPTGWNSAADLVEVVGESEAHHLEVPAQASAGSTAGNGECLGTGVALYTPDGELLTTLDERICDGRTLVIEDEDLR